VHAPVGSFAPNRFGLHDMAGNVQELCADAEHRYGEVPPRAGDGLRAAPQGDAASAKRIARGGGWQWVCQLARSADRQEVDPGIRSNLVGVRFARRIER
jgi:formylglycine-generating enzyme required for sulfatase activity